MVSTCTNPDAFENIAEDWSTFDCVNLHTNWQADVNPGVSSSYSDMAGTGYGHDWAYGDTQGFGQYVAPQDHGDFSYAAHSHDSFSHEGSVEHRCNGFLQILIQDHYM